VKRKVFFIWAGVMFFVFSVVCFFSARAGDGDKPDTVTASGESDNDSSNVPAWLQRTSYGMSIETDQKPRIYLETVQPLYQTDDKVNTVFTHSRVSIQDERGTYSTGLGYRRLISDKLLAGVNTFFDYQDLHRHSRQGAGLELLSQYLELRANTYNHLSGRRTVDETPSSITYEKVVDGYDLELGGPVPYLPWLKLFGQYYYYDYKQAKNMAGNKIRAEIKPFKWVTCNLATYDDNKGDREYVMDIRFSVAFDTFTAKSFLTAFKPTCDAFPTVDLKKHTLDRVERNFNIQVEKWKKTGNMTIAVGRGS